MVKKCAKFSSQSLFYCFSRHADSGTSECTTDTDCFSGEVCGEGQCGAPTTNNATNNGTNNSNNSNNSNNVNNTNNSNNTQTNNSNNASNNSNNSNNTNNTEGPCLVDPFSVSCMDDGNDDFSESFDTSTHGCDNSDEFVPWELERNERMCGLEIRDRFSQILFPCDDIAFILDVEFTPKAVCPDLYTIEIGAQGKNCDEPDDDIQCTVNADGSIEASIIIRPSRSLEQAFIKIDKGEAGNVDFDYDLTLRVRQ